MTSYIGVDIGKRNLQLFEPTSNTSFEITNNLAGFKKLLATIHKHYNNLSQVMIVFEPTGGYENEFRKFLKEMKLNFTTIHPNKVRAFAKAKGLLAKTDKIDSELLHSYAATFKLKAKQQYSTEAQEELHSFIKRREQLILFINQETNRLENEDNIDIVRSLKKHIKHIEKQLEVTEQQIKEVIETSNEIKEKHDRLTSIPGVGPVLASAAICEVPELGLLDFNELTALVGVAPFARESGSYKGRRSIFAGRNKFRKVLYMASVASLRCNNILANFYNRLIKNHKPPKVALVAVMRKLLGIMHAILKNNTSWTDNYAKN